MSDVEMESVNGDDNDLNFTEKGILSSEEEGEILDSNDEENENDSRKHTFMKDGVERINQSVFGDKDLAKMEDRAKRFGIGSEIDLYTSLGISEGSEERRHTRLDTVHMYGVQNLDTNDIFQYFYTHKPLLLEWVNESSCNVAWPDDLLAAKAMLFYSRERSEKEVDAPPGKWRLGVPHPKAECILLRFATRSDKKVIGVEKLEILSKKYKSAEVSERANHVDAGLISNSMKNQIQTLHLDAYNSKEDKEVTKNPWGELCQTWGINDAQEIFGPPPHKLSTSESYLPHSINQCSVKDRIGKPLPSRVQNMPEERKGNSNLKMRLGKRTHHIMPVRNPQDEAEESSDEEWTCRSKVPRMRMHADDEQKRIDRGKLRSRLGGQEYGDEENIDTITIEIRNDTASHHRHRERSRVGHTKGDLRARLRRRRVEQSDTSGSDKEEDLLSSSSVWSRLNSRVKQESHSNSDEDGKYPVSKVSYKVPNRRPGFEKADLRSRLGKKRVPGSPLRIEVDNEHYVHSE